MILTALVVLVLLLLVNALDREAGALLLLTGFLLFGVVYVGAVAAGIWWVVQLVGVQR